MNILAACTGADSPVRKFVFKSSTHYYGCEQDDPAFFTEQMRRPHAPRTLIERDIVEAEAAVADFAAKNPDVTVTILRCANVLGPDVDTAFTADARAAACADGARLRPATAVRARGRRRPRARARDAQPGPWHLQRRRRRGARPLRGGLAGRQAPVAGAAAVGGRLLAAPLRRLGFRVPDEMRQPVALRARGRQPPLQGDRLPLRLHVARDRAQARRAPAPAADPAPAPARSPTTTSARSRSSCAGAHTCAASAPRTASPPTTSRWASAPAIAAALKCARRRGGGFYTLQTALGSQAPDSSSYSSSPSCSWRPWARTRGTRPSRTRSPRA